jgi:hypothetical protein
VAPGSSAGHAYGHDDAQEAELQGFDELEASGVGGQWRHHTQDEQYEGEDTEGEPDPGHRTARPHATAGPHVGGPIGHWEDRRWKKPQSRTTKSVPNGIAKVSTSGPIQMSVARFMY